MRLIRSNKMVSFGEMQLKLEDWSCVHASDELHLHVVHVIPMSMNLINIGSMQVFDQFNISNEFTSFSRKSIQKLGITSITVNGKNAYELKGKFLDDLHKNAFSGANEEDAVEHIEYFLKIVDPIDLPNVNQDKLRVVVFSISLVRDAWRWFDGIKGSITSWVDLTNNFFRKYFPPSGTGKVNTPIIKWDPTNPKFENWYSEWPTCGLKEDGYCNGGNLPGAYIVGNTLRYQDLEWYDALKDGELKEEALRNKAIMEGLINEDDESSNNDEERCELFDNHELPVFTIRRFEMIKYSFGQDEEYVVFKEDEYDDLTRTSEDACRAYQEIFRMMDEGWMTSIRRIRSIPYGVLNVWTTSLKEKKSTMLVENLRSGNLEVLES
ncbi:hypothetical protein Tco_0632752 [Tanacetum coccineum]